MKNLIEVLNESSNTIRMYMGPWPEKKWDGGFITTDSKTAAESQRIFKRNLICMEVFY